MEINPLLENRLSNKEHRSLVRMEEVAAVVMRIAITIGILGFIIGMIALSPAIHSFPLALVGVSMTVSSILGIFTCERIAASAQLALKENPLKIVPDVYELGEFC